jgi:predicted Zn-dependent protease
MRVVRMEQERIWWSAAALAGGLALAAALSGCKVGGVDGKVGLGQSTGADTQATMGSTVAGSVSGTPKVLGPVHFTEAEAVYREGRYSEAVALFGAYAESKPDNAWGQYMLGLSAWKAGDRERAETAFKKALELDPRHLKSRINLSRVLLEANRPDEALSQLDSVRTVDSTSAEVYRLIGRARSEQGQVDAAVAAYRTAVTLDSVDVWALNDLGVLYIEQGLPGDAIGALARAVDLQPEVAVFHNNLGMALERWGYFTNAQDQYRLAVGADSGYAKAAANLQRIEGHPDRPGLPPLDLAVQAQDFLKAVIRP